ncbi:integrator complex subunit 7-like isoform X2 [Ruditapes philippinarum]|uniref:integrator complex subunit 7-like isoform X2 n=1 Tax=Ruditapes philippinarum TaxID=129788 RepID=UPI00295C02E1|nr:integrator complex subunit 7-like isoform X2 [Ruditapes philippinarum]
MTTREITNNLSKAAEAINFNKRLRSMNVGVQCEAVVKFPRLFEKYPFPILINSAFLRLADVFRAGNNFIRWCILRVTQESEKHLDKILNVDEFMRRVFTVYHSNDPIARAITLRTLGNISLIIAERKNIHHSITVSLDSNDAVEVKAAIFAAQKFSEQSRVFAANICDKISEMIHSVATPVKLKLSLIPVLQYMHHDVTMATKARNVCSALLSSYPAEMFMVQTLRTMSHLAILSLIDVPTQIDLLLQHLHVDSRRNVNIVCLQELKKLAVKTSHLWTYQQIQAVCEFIQNSTYIGLKTGAVDVLVSLSKAVTFKIVFAKQDFHRSLLDVCNLCYVHDNPVLMSKLTEFYTNIVISYSKTKGTEYWCGQNLVDNVVTAIQTHIMVLITDTQDTKPLKLCLRCAVELSKHQPKVADTFVTCIASLLSESQGQSDAALCESLAAIGSLNQSLLPKSVVPQLLGVLQNSLNAGLEPHQMQVYLCTVLFQVASGTAIPVDVEGLILSCTERSDPWLAYKTARQALRYGQCGIAEKIFQALAKKVSSEHFYFWLIGLHEITLGEKCLHVDTGSVIAKLQQALSFYHKGLTSLKAAVVPSFPLQFQSEYIQLRASLLDVHTQLLRTCNTFKTCPPPAIAAAQAVAKGQELTKCEHTVTQLGKTASDYEKISERLAALYQQSFDADPASLQNIQQLQTSCELMKLAISSIVQNGHDGQALLADKMVLGVGEVTGDKFKQLLNTVHTELATLLRTEGTEVISHNHVEFLSEAASRLALAPNCFPRYFFQSLQQTALKLAISPQQTATEPVLVQNDTYLTLKVEGIVQHGTKPGLFRKIHSINIIVTSNVVSRTQTNTDQKVTESSVNNLEQSVEPHNDYFSLSFILRFPLVGIHSVSIEAAITDTEGATWRTGPKVNLQVKSYDDALQRQQQKLPQRPSYSQLLTS